ncbi:MAG: 16S rRNA (cytosine(1402)-N(4))-methyltransferase RsmH [Nocardioidaceae bacterium]
MTSPHHEPVLLERVVALVAPALDAEGSVLVDATVGLGGHSAAILAHCPNAHLVGLDRDPQALLVAADRLQDFAGRTTLVHAVYDQLPRVIAELGLRRVNGVLFDLGVSSMQLDLRERGFAYAQDAPLDMRMDATSGRTAADVLNTYSAAGLARVLSRYGEERFARRIAESVVRSRSQQPFDTSARLVALIRDSIPAAARRTGGNPAKRTFQALRIEVNDELAVLERALPAAIDALAVGGRIVVMSYHSLEDRLAKHALAERSRSTVPVDLPVVPAGHEPELRLLTRGAELATGAEVGQNPRAASVRVRAAERVRAVKEAA